MNIQVNKNQLERVVIKWLNRYFGNLIPKKHKDHPNSVFYVNTDNKVMMEYIQENEYVWIDYYNFWSIIKSLFHINHNDVQSIMIVWLEETYKLEGVTPGPNGKMKADVLEEDYKLD